MTIYIMVFPSLDRLQNLGNLYNTQIKTFGATNEFMLIASAELGQGLGE